MKIIFRAPDDDLARGSIPALTKPGSIWEKLDLAQLKQAAGATTATADAATKTPQKKDWNLPLWGLDLIATIFWVYAVTKVFFFDVDVWLTSHLLPQAQWTLGWRFLVLLALLASWAVIMGRLQFVLILLYVVFFPFVVLFWKVPRRLYRGRSWIPIFGFLDVMTNVVRDYRFALASAALALTSAAVILAGKSSSWLIATAGGITALLLFLLIGRAFWRSVNPSRFIRSQATLLDKLVNSAIFSALWRIPDDLKSPAVSKFTPTQQSQFMQNIVMGVLGQRVIYWWAYQLDSYRRSPAPFVLNFLTYFRVFLAAVIGFALINLAIFRTDPNAFAYSGQPGAFDFIHYSINILTAGPVDLIPKAAIALAVADAARVTGLLVVITFLATVLFSVRSTKQDDALRESVAVFRRRGREFDRRFADQYELTVAEAIERLKELRPAALRFVAYFSSRIPSDFEGDSEKKA